MEGAAEQEHNGNKKLGRLIALTGEGASAWLTADGFVGYDWGGVMGNLV